MSKSVIVMVGCLENVKKKVVLYVDLRVVRSYGEIYRCTVVYLREEDVYGWAVK